MLHTVYWHHCAASIDFLCRFLVAAGDMDHKETPFRYWRRKMGLSQIGAAKELGYGISQIAEYDRGAVRPPFVVLRAMSAIERGIPPYSLEDAA